MLVTLAGHDIFKGRALLMPSTPADYANFMVAHGEPKRLGGLEIDDKLELGGLLDRQVGRLRAS